MDIQSLLQIDLFLQVYGITSGRAAALIPAALGLISIILGRFALIRSAYPTGSARLKTMAALVLALTCIIFSVLHLARATGAIGTGSGRLGAIVALIFGMIGVILSGMALARSRRIARRSSTAVTTNHKERT
jgi:hypothetical protein